MKKLAMGILACAAVFLLPRPSVAQDSAQVFSLPDCITLAIRNNPDVREAGYTLQASRVNRTQAKAAMLPSLSGSISRALYDGKSIDPYTNTYVNQGYTADNYGLNAQVTLWNGFSIQRFIRENTLTVKASEMDFEQAKDEMTIQVILAYLSALDNQEQLKIARQQVAVTSQQVDRLTLLHQDGAVAPSDLYNMRGQLATNQLAVLSATQALEQAKLDLSQLMNIPYSADMTLQPVQEQTLSAYTGTVEDIYRDALEHLAMVKAADLHQQSAEQQVKVMRAQLLPTLSLSGGLYTNYSSAASTSNLTGVTEEATDHYVKIGGEQAPVYAPVSHYQQLKVPYGNQWKNNFNSGVSLNLSIPILNGLKARSQVNLAKIQADQAAFRQQTVKTQLKQAVERDFMNMRIAYETYRKLMLQVADYEESFREAQVKFEAGALNVVEFQLVQQHYDEARLSLVSAKYRYLLQTKVLDYYQGKLSWD